MIVPMSRVHVVGPRRLLDDVIALLQEHAIVHLKPLPVPIESWAVNVPVRGDPGAHERLERAVTRIVETLSALPLPAPGASSERPIDPGAPDLGARCDAILAEIHALDERRAALDDERSVLARYRKVLTALSPLLGKLDGATKVEALGIVLRRKDKETLALFEEEVARLTGGAYTLLLRDIDDETVGGLLAVARHVAPAVEQLLFEKGVSEVKLPDRYAGRTFGEGVKMLIARTTEIGRELEATDRDRHLLARRWREPLSAALRSAREQLARLRAVMFCGGTKHAFLVAGWAPEERLPELRRALGESFGERVTVFDEPPRRDEADDVPVVLKNRRWLKPFELLLSLQPLPRYGSIDPTPFMALFFPLYFGLILGDIGHGTLALAVAGLVWRKGWFGATGRKIAAVAATAAVSAIVFGILFGEFFGLGHEIGLTPILLDRKKDMMVLLAFVVGLGALQISLGLVLGFVAALRQSHPRRAIARLVTLAVIVDAALALAGARGVLAPGATTIALIAIGPLVVAAIILEGLLAPLELVRTLGSILSYSRLMAVGLAAVMLSEVANRLAVVVKPFALGLFLAVLLHAVNFTLGLLSPAIQAMRLQYVEFFDTFFVPGGRPYTPLAPVG